jgi:hypothetical protein
LVGAAGALIGGNDSLFAVITPVAGLAGASTWMSIKGGFRETLIGKKGLDMLELAGQIRKSSRRMTPAQASNVRLLEASAESTSFLPDHDFAKEEFRLAIYRLSGAFLAGVGTIPTVTFAVDLASKLFS